MCNIFHAILFLMQRKKYEKLRFNEYCIGRSKSNERHEHDYTLFITMYDTKFIVAKVKTFVVENIIFIDQK